MTTTAELDALAARIAAGSGADREIDTRFAWDVLGIGNTPMGLAEFTDALAGPGALFAAARALWPECSIATDTTTRGSAVTFYPRDLAAFSDTDAPSYLEAEHPDLCRALMLAITAAKRAEIAGGGE